MNRIRLRRGQEAIKQRERLESSPICSANKERLRRDQLVTANDLLE